MCYVLFYHVLVYQNKEIKSTLLSNPLMYHVFFSHVSRIFFSLISSQTLDNTDFLTPPKVYIKYI